ncbi:MAG TPA: amylo-alpha-1,6-glucosidase [Gemmatimonadaceae bacterium]|nr:amylo-alpha-1,6-glucosidase [Gemmatimonadaceae bacterium]
MSATLDPRAEWLETDGLGGFASGRADGVRTRRYHAVLLAATTPPTGRVVLVNGFDAWVELPPDTSGTAMVPERYAITSQRYAPDVTHPDGAARLVAFTREPWPTWTFRLPSGAEVVQELTALHGAPIVALSWRLLGATGAVLVVRPFLSGRDTHATHHENGAFRFDARVEGPRITWRPYDGVPDIAALASGTYRHDPLWYRNFQYDDERARGLDFTEDLASPGELALPLSPDRAALVLAAGDAAVRLDGPAVACAERIRALERARRARFPSFLHRAADDYVVRRGAGRTVVAGYPWFSDWGRDTFISLRGLCIAGSRAGSVRLDDARGILLEWSRHVSEGMLPNFFPEGGQAAEYNSVDASLWFVIAVHELLGVRGCARTIPADDRAALLTAVDAVIAGYAAGTRFGIRADGDGLLAAGVSGVQLTWMDARVDGREITPRIGKPVEVQALWINALRIAGRRSARWAVMARAAQASFARRFWNAERGCLYDVVDVDHVPGTADASLRPNQIFAVGGLPWPVLGGARARSVVDAVEARLWTPAGPRSLAPGEPGYTARYGGDMRARDAAYHQGTVWPWLAGAFIEAWLRVRGGTPEARQEARTRFLAPLLEHYAGSVPGHLAEIADADAPHAPNGCPFQAWSVGEALRAAVHVLGVDPRASLAPDGVAVSAG